MTARPGPQPTVPTARAGRARGRGTAAAIAVSLTCAALAIMAAVQPDPRLPANPHAPLNNPAGCLTCHATYRGELDPHVFAIEIPPECWKCHPPEVLGRSHPVGVDPRRSSPPITVTNDLPLEDEMVSCGTCHQPHGEYLSLVKVGEKQEPFIVLVEGDNEIPWYKTYYLRISDPVSGTEPLCTSCHLDY